MATMPYLLVFQNCTQLAAHWGGGQGDLWRRPSTAGLPSLLPGHTSPRPKLLHLGAIQMQGRRGQKSTRFFCATTPCCSQCPSRLPLPTAPSLRLWSVSFSPFQSSLKFDYCQTSFYKYLSSSLEITCNLELFQFYTSNEYDL